MAILIQSQRNTGEAYGQEEHRKAILCGGGAPDRMWFDKMTTTAPLYWSVQIKSDRFTESTVSYLVQAC
jgi:hypothetical protein